jgi:general secretion pathway protein D
LVNGNSEPIITTREANSYVSVNDGQMIVLGGLQKTEKTQTHNKLGFLFEIPILSQLLGAHTDTLQKDELLVFIRPHIIRPSETTSDTQKDIGHLSNKDELNHFLENPSDQPNGKVKNVLDRFKDNAD